MGKEKVGSTEIRTRILGFRVPGANHYTIEPFTSAGCARSLAVFSVCPGGSEEDTEGERETPCSLVQGRSAGCSGCCHVRQQLIMVYAKKSSSV